MRVVKRFGYNFLATNKLEQTAISTPAIAGGCLLFRTAESLIAISEME